MTTENQPTCDAPEDVISSLPENVLSKIMESLPLCDAARVSVLSKTWRFIWLSLPKLTFDAKFFQDALKEKRFELSEIYALVSKVLHYHVGPVTKFYLYLPRLKSTECSIASCLSYLSENGVKEITIQSQPQQRIKLSSYLFSCLNLKKLHVYRCILDLPSPFNSFRNLRKLQFYKVSLVGDSLRRLIDCCQQLGSLNLLKWSGSMDMYIAAPKLKHLTLSGIFETVSLRRPQNLISLSMTLDKMVENYQIPKLKELVKLLSGSRKLKKLSLSGNTCKLLAVGGIVSMLPFKYMRLKVLQLSNIHVNDNDEFQCVIFMIRSCPVVEVLKISVSIKLPDHIILAYPQDYQFKSVTSAEHKLDDAKCCLLDRLREVKVDGVLGFRMELKLIEFLLIHSPALQKFHVERSLTINPNMESEMTRQLMRFPRASPRAEIIYVDPNSDCVKKKWVIM